VVSGPGGGTVEGNTEPTLVLKDLPEGVYHVKVTVSVTGEHKDKYLPGEQHINITVLPAPRENKPPRVVFGTQSNVTLRLPDAKYILSASGTTDDGEGPLKYKWELELKPVGAPNIDLSTGDRMELNNLHEGKYVIKLTVTDSEGASSSKNAFITVLPEKDDPPTADTGESVYQIQLPQDKVVIFANRSKDDHGIKDYNWEIINPKDEDKLININGADTPFLTLSGLRQGSYQFKLTVTDTKGQTDSKMVSVVVNAESFNPPVARAGSNVNVSYPASSVKLNGSTSRDDYKIVAYSWTLLSGPEDVKIEDSDKAIATATNLHIEGTSPTVYTFQLNVTNYRHLSSQSTVNVTVCKESNVPPTADAGPDLVVHLPQHQVVLDGSGSHDDFGIKEFKWNRSSDSPAAGIVEEGSESMAILKLSNVVMGVYRLMLCVTNTKGQSSCDTTVLTVLPASNNLSIVQLVVDQEVTQLTAGSLESLMTGVRLELEMQQLERVDLTVTDVYPLESRTVVEFIVTQEVTHDPLNGSVILQKLEAYLGGGVIRDIPLTKVDTKVCQNPCSGHGTCDQRTKTCKCDIFWMENFVSSNVGAKRSNCEWSVLYFVLIILGIVLIFFFICWIACCCHIRRRRNKRRKRIKYALLQNQNEEDGRSIKLREKRQHRGQVLMSETDSEDDVLFDKKSNSSETPPPGYNNLGNGKISSKASSLVRGLIPH
jgi:cbb3-type cytochrome oxidase subunit 3